VALAGRVPVVLAKVPKVRCGVLLVDGEQRQVHEVTFPMSQPQARKVSSARFAVYVVLALPVALGLWAVSRSL
jgi:hypothetical protein